MLGDYLGNSESFCRLSRLRSTSYAKCVYTDSNALSNSFGHCAYGRLNNELLDRSHPLVAYLAHRGDVCSWIACYVWIVCVGPLNPVTVLIVPCA